jgi:hypothetical protein
MFIYSVTKSDAIPITNQVTSGTANTEVVHFRYQTAAASARGAAIQLINAVGKAAAATTISGISLRFIRRATLTTGGTAVTPRPRDPLAPAAVTTVFDEATAFVVTTAASTYQGGVGFGKAGPGLWFAINPDSGIILSANGGANGNLDIASSSSEAAALPFEINAIEHAE